MIIKSQRTHKISLALYLLTTTVSVKVTLNYIYVAVEKHIKGY